MRSLCSPLNDGMYYKSRTGLKKIRHRSWAQSILRYEHTNKTQACGPKEELALLIWCGRPTKMISKRSIYAHPMALIVKSSVPVWLSTIKPNSHSSLDHFRLSNCRERERWEEETMARASHTRAWPCINLSDGTPSLARACALSCGTFFALYFRLIDRKPNLISISLV